MRLILTVGAAAAVVAACAPLPPAATPAARVITLNERFDPADFAWARESGTNIIEGAAIMRTIGGDVKTCGGLAVELIPETAYSRERVQALYLSADEGFQSAIAMGENAPIAGHNPPEYRDVVRQTVCGPDGRFRFTGLPDGSYFVIAEVTWGAPTVYGIEPQGGRMMRRVTVSGGQTSEIVLTRSGK